MWKLSDMFLFFFICLSIGVYGQNPNLTPSGAVKKITGETLVLTCSFTDTSAPQSVTWKNDSATIVVLVASDCSLFTGALPSGYTKTCTTTSPYTYTLTTSALADSDDAKWTCVVLDSLNADQTSPEAVVTVDAESTTKPDGGSNTGVYVGVVIAVVVVLVVVGLFLINRRMKQNDGKGLFSRLTG